MHTVVNGILLILGVLAIIGGILFLAVALILFFTGEAKIAGIFVVPGLAVLYAGM